MSNEELEIIAVDCGFVSNWNVLRMLSIVAHKEREACAKLCESEWTSEVERDVGKMFAAEIRARGDA